MQDRIIAFVQGLRAAGVPVSVAEGLDALTAVDHLGVADKTRFQQLLRATLIKSTRDNEAFDELFPLYFGLAEPNLQNAVDQLNPDEQEMLEMALSGFSQRLQNLMQMLASGQTPTREQLEQMAQQAGIRWAESPAQGVWVTQRMLEQMGFGELPQMLMELTRQLQEMGMAEESIENLLGVVNLNQEQLERFIAQDVGRQIAERRTKRPRDLHGPDLMQKSFGSLTASDIQQLRLELRRLLNQMRTRAALRQKKGRIGKLDARRTLRASQRYGGVPFELQFKKKKLKPELVFIFDVSRSMRLTVEFMLYFVFELQDQLSRTRSFAFYDNLGEVSQVVNGLDTDHMEQAFQQIQQAIPGYLYGTDLGHSLKTFFNDYLESVNRRTTVIVMGDGRNNGYNPRLDLVRELQRRAKRLIWFTPEPQRLWGTGDSDMNLYAPLCDAVYPVRNLAQLATAIDQLLVGN